MRPSARSRLIRTSRSSARPRRRQARWRMRSNAAAAPTAGSGAAPPASPATWKSVLMAHLNCYKRYPPGAATTGTASVAFTIARSGQVLSTRLISSSGNQALDAEAVSLPRRREPRPCPAAGFRRRRPHSHCPHSFRRVKDHLSNRFYLIDCPSSQQRLGLTDATQALENGSLQRRATKRPRQQNTPPQDSKPRVKSDSGAERFADERACRVRHEETALIGDVVHVHVETSVFWCRSRMRRWR